MQTNQQLDPIIHPKRRPRVTQNWKHRTKRCHQYHRTPSITLHPGYAWMDDDGTFIVPFSEEITY